ncbi:uncharacterized protein LOC130131666 [Lampris incognitus]|uniref:uncharacterized protein LOC130131666 n=1 Tax=Lampris incognitus TaxID=2546036 RepID=UPI0024B58E23|nr:uncharacterized protein LOC130131666 [Lampris incognitus]
MNEKPLESLTSEGENKEEKIKQGGTEVKNSKNISDEVAPVALAPLDAPSSSPNAKETVTSVSREIDVGKRTKAAAGEHPVDWFEPLEDDDDAAVWDFPGNDRNLNSGRDAEEESLAGESEKSGSIASSDRTIKRVYQLNFHRRRRAIHDEGWVDWPVLGEGWKRKEVIRRSGSSIGQKDVYYLSPQGDRVRSRVELTSVLEGMTDLSTFDFKSGKFYNGDAPQLKRGKRKMERSSSESSWMDRGEGADTPDSYHRFTPTMVSKLSEFSQKSFSPYSLNEPLNKDFEGENAVKENRIKLPYTTSSRLLPSINGPVGSEETSL